MTTRGVSNAEIRAWVSELTGWRLAGLVISLEALAAFARLRDRLRNAIIWQKTGG